MLVVTPNTSAPAPSGQTPGLPSSPAAKFATPVAATVLAPFPSSALRLNGVRHASLSPESSRRVGRTEHVLPPAASHGGEAGPREAPRLRAQRAEGVRVGPDARGGEHVHRAPQGRAHQALPLHHQGYPRRGRHPRQPAIPQPRPDAPSEDRLIVLDNRGW